ncbi:MAG: hypothetical protein AB1757_20230 [Acidobacteriota bacterium]
MRVSILTFLLGGLLFAATSLTAFEQSFRVRAGNSVFSERTTISIAIDGEDCACATAPTKAQADAQGYATVLIKADCVTVDTTKCRATAWAEAMAGGKLTRFTGSARLVATSSGIYISTVVLTP